MAVYLRGMDAANAGRKLNLKPGTWRLLTAETGFELLPDDPSAPGARLRVEPRAIMVEPREAVVAVDGQPQREPFRVRPGQTLAVGSAVLILEADRPTEATAPPVAAPAPPPPAVAPPPPPRQPVARPVQLPPAEAAPIGIALPPPDPPKWRNLLRFGALLVVVVVAVAVWKAIPKQLSVEEHFSAEVRQRVQAATVWVKAEDAGAEGSGYVPRAGYVLTNAHVLNNGKDIKVVYNSGQSNAAKFSAKVLKVGQPGTPNDLALLKVDTGAIKPLPLCDLSTLTEGAETAAFGYPMGGEASLNQLGPSISIRGGKVTSKRTDNGRVGWVETDIVAEVGNSGGPVVTTKGEVVGLATMIVGPNLRMAWVASSDMIRAFAPEVAGK
ncbi:MAG: trypsin-like peptidase domain-containing protein [Armatimonadetes bacterium]|nr:trypsin-like peptidase domain-containing protein [Armatimonadota bacterium]